MVFRAECDIVAGKRPYNSEKPLTAQAGQSNIPNMLFYDTGEKDALPELRLAFASRSQNAASDAEAVVKAILEDVQAHGDAAVLGYTRRWDFSSAQALRVPPEAIEVAAERIRQTPLWDAMTLSASRIRSFHQKQIPQSWFDTSTPGEILGQVVRPLHRVGLYAPGGTAAYPSTVLMTAIPAQVAGVPNIALATPPSGETGVPPDATLAAASLAGVTEVYAMGGAQAVAAFAFGTETVSAVDKICGPGNLYVNLAKKLVYGRVGIDMLAGPSEVAVLADDFADPDFAAADLLTQAEHDPNGSILVVSPSALILEKIQRSLVKQLLNAPRRAICEQVLQRNGFFVKTRTLEEAAEIVSLYAAEHLHLCVQQPWELMGYIRSAGAILMGRHASAPLGDYVAGPSHTLPTAGCARWASPLNVEDFVKRSSLLYFDETSGRALSETAAVFADFEGLPAHASAARLALKKPADGAATGE